MHRDGEVERASGGGEEDGPAQAAEAGAAVQRGGDHARLPPPAHRGDVRQLPGGRRAVGGDGVSGGRRTHRHRDARAHGRGADRQRVQAVPQGAGLPALAGRDPPRHQERLHPAGQRRPRQALRLRLLRPSVDGPAEPEVARGHALLDGARGHLPAALRPRGRHLVARHHGHRDGGRRTSLLQRAASAGHAPHPGHAASQAQKYSQGFTPASGLLGKNAGSRPFPESNCL